MGLGSEGDDRKEERVDGVGWLGGYFTVRTRANGGMG